MIGVFQDNFGGGIKYLPGIKEIKFMLEWKLLKKMDGFKMKMS